MIEQNQKKHWFFRDKSTRGFSSLKDKIRFRLWKYMGSLLFKWTLDPLNFLRIWQLKLYGAKIGRNVYISRKATFVLPWLLKVGDNCGFDEFSYVNGRLTVGNNVSISSFAKIVTAGHDVRSRAFTWTTSHFEIQDGVFIGANSFIMGDGVIGTFAVIGANSFVNKNVDANTIVAGNPIKILGKRIKDEDFDRYSFA